MFLFHCVAISDMDKRRRSHGFPAGLGVEMIEVE